MPAEESGRMLLSLPAASAQGWVDQALRFGAAPVSFLRRQVHWQQVAVVETADGMI
jgi:hypothetical protein